MVDIQRIFKIEDIKRVPTNQLPNPQIYRINLLPRSYDESVDKSLHTNGFRMTGKTANYFPAAEENLLTEVGKERLARGTATFDAFMGKNKAAADYYQNNKRTVLASQYKPLWVPTLSVPDKDNQAV